MPVDGNSQIVVSQGATLELNNLSGNNNNRLPDAQNITLTGGTITILGTGSTTETLGPITMTAQFSDTLQADGALSRSMG